MARWTIQDVHTAAEFSVRHMMITFVRGHFKNISGTLDFDPDHPERATHRERRVQRDAGLVRT